jgi:hypothetical protein
LITISILLVTLLETPALARKNVSHVCNREDAERAESEASSLDTWNQIYASYKRFRQCDDAAISEGYSASISELLAVRWDQLSELLALMDAHPSFRQFVLRHLDATMSLDDATSIERNIRKACPPRGASFCAAVRKRLDELNNEPTQVTDETTDRPADEAPVRPRQVPDKHGPR